MVGLVAVPTERPMSSPFPPIAASAIGENQAAGVFLPVFAT
jgi:hypothetical protein